ncbi:hypothetical protein HKX48_002238 [Thoreauomyces humboldtii]|nr:hypothetical protein HKX48_002238 [Thoreauomyces humboldtii]
MAPHADPQQGRKSLEGTGLEETSLNASSHVSSNIKDPVDLLLNSDEPEEESYSSRVAQQRVFERAKTPAENGDAKEAVALSVENEPSTVAGDISVIVVPTLNLEDTADASQSMETSTPKSTNGCRCGTITVSSKVCPLYVINRKRAVDEMSDPEVHTQKARSRKLAKVAAPTAVVAGLPVVGLVLQTACFEGLSVELKLVIAGWFELQALKRLSKTSRFWSGLLSENNFWVNWNSMRGGFPTVSHGGEAQSTRAKEAYKLPDHILSDSDLDCIRVKNRHNRMHPIRLYHEKSVKILSYQTHGGPRGLDKLLAKSRERSEKLRIRKELARKARVRQFEERAPFYKELQWQYDHGVEAYFQGGSHAAPIDILILSLTGAHEREFHSNYKELIRLSEAIMEEQEKNDKAGNSVTGDLPPWELAMSRWGDSVHLDKAKSESWFLQTKKAVDLLCEAEKAYAALPEDERTAKVCACGHPLIKDRLPATIATPPKVWVKPPKTEAERQWECDQYEPTDYM